MGEKIVAIKKDQNGDIAYVKTDDGAILSIEEAQVLAREGKIDSLASLDKEGNWTILYSAGNGETVTGNNLDQLPEFD
jgi:hypothetical protein